MNIGNLLYMSCGLLAGLVVGVKGVSDFTATAENLPSSQELLVDGESLHTDESMAEGFASIVIGADNPLATLEVYTSSPAFIVVRDAQNQLLAETELEPGENRLLSADIAPPRTEDDGRALSRSVPEVPQTPSYLEKRTSQWVWAGEALPGGQLARGE